MTRKEALIKLAKGHRVRLGSWTHWMEADGRIRAELDGGQGIVSNAWLTESEAYELVKEPLHYEGMLVVTRGYIKPGSYDKWCSIDIPISFLHKRVKVVVEEIV